ncbi:solute carrier family 23 protein [Terribacillus saccharophilus]|uniref:Uracil permease n=1 Tax=Terribacillus saccharophilus TaxID=361277 RepID=A0A268AA70_9BACI|nr:solute carrier family 23 protein [Terribacillus saccharophilus]PAD21021.1 uracil permease [Terribacillus saccharophilus]PAF22081.1 uracil permease [Terribacillus saccharophilus]
MKPALNIHDIPKWNQWIIFSLQHLFAMFGATILVPALTGLDPAVALVSSGVGTLAFILITRGTVPAYLGSSFAFIYPITQAIETAGIGGAMIGSFFAGLAYGVVAIAIRLGGLKSIIKLLPPIVVGPVIIVIGLALAPTAVDMAMNAPDTGEYSTKYFTIALVTLAITVAASIFLKGFLGLIPVLIGIIGGYVFALTQGIVDTSGVQAAWNQIVTADSIGAFFSGIFTVPNFTIPFVDYNVADVFSWQLFFTMVPIAVVTVSEHIGHQLALSKIVDQNMLVKPGLHTSLAGDGVATIIASVLGGPPNTTYGENIGVLAITRVFSVFVIGGTAVLAILFGFTGLITALISSVPSAVMGGVSIMLFGIIAASGLRTMIDSQLDLGDKRNLIISSIILVIGIGGAFLRFQIADLDLEINSMALAALVGVVMNLVLPGKESGLGNGSLFTVEDQKQAASK